MVDPAWIEAVAASLAAAEGGVTMFNNKKSGEKAASPAPTPIAVELRGMTGQEYLFGILLLSLALIGAALIIHHGLTA